MTEPPPVGDAPDETQLRTFLIADVRGYTAYTRRFGDEAAGKLAGAFAVIVREVVGPRSGFLLELRGDEALVVFASARQALRAAIELQERIAQAGLERGVGIGLDAGEAVAVEGGFRGGALNLAARLCAQARAGQVLASETVIHLAARVDGVSYVDPRTYNLKGFAEPVRAVEVVAADRVPQGFARRVRRARSRVRSHGRLLVGGAVVAAAAIAALLILPAAFRPPPAPALPPGIALLEGVTGKEIAHISTAQVKQPVAAFFAQGSFWVINLDPLSFVQIDAKTGKVGRQIASPLPDPADMTVDGNELWLTDNANLVLVKIDIALGREVKRYELDLGPDATGGLRGMALTPDSVWVSHDCAEILRLDRADGSVQERLPDVFGCHLAYADGSIWTAGDLLYRIDAGTSAVTLSTARARFDSVAGGAGFGWTSDNEKGTVSKIDPGGSVLATYPTGLGASGPSFSDGMVWVANKDVGTVTHIDAVTGALGSLTFEHPVEGVAAGDGSVLVLLSEGRTYEDRIDSLPGKVVRLFVPAGALATDPAVANDGAGVSFMVERATCAPLLRYTEASDGTVELQPEVAAALPELAADGRTYTFTVRPGYRFSPPADEPVTAETFRYSIERALSPALGGDAPGSQFLADIQGERKFLDGGADHISGLTASGDKLSISLTQPSADFLVRLAEPYFCPVPLDTAIVEGGLGDRAPMAAAGPYYVAERLGGEYTILRRNPGYGGQRPHEPDAIALREGVDAGVAVSRVEEGSWDGILFSTDPILEPRSVLASQWGADSPAAAQGDQRYYALPGGAVYYLEFNAGRPPFAQRDARQAVSLALDRKALATEWNDGVPWDSVLAPDPEVASSTSQPIAGPDLEAARKLLGPPPAQPVVLVASQLNEEVVRISKAVAAQLGKIGLEVKVELVQSSVDAIRKPNAPYDLKVGGSWPDSPDRAQFLRRLLNEDIPPEWLPPSLRGVADKIGAQGRDAAAEALASGPVAEEMPLAVVGYQAWSAFFSSQLGCRDFLRDRDRLELGSLCRQP